MRVLISAGAILLVAAAPLAAQIDTTFNVGASGTLRLDNHRGSVLVRGWDRQSVRVQATHARRDEIEVRASSGVVRIDADATHGLAGNVEYEIDVPRGWALSIDGHDTPIVIQDTRGDVRAENLSGDVTVSGVLAARLETVHGAVSLSDARGTVNIDNVNEGIRVENVVGDVSAETVNGGITLDGIDGATVRAETVNGRILFSGRIQDGGTYSFVTHQGDVTLTIPGSTNANVSVATFGGSIEADFPVQVRGDITRRGELAFTIGRGGTSLRAESFNGAIRILRADRR
jgi:DUF4097 and DUF4098 domain-containing protein YvlB